MPPDRRAELPADEREHFLAAALELADACRSAIRERVASGIRVHVKADASLVTDADVEAERAFREGVQARFPDAGVIGEEFGVRNPEAPYQWIIDPIDGTTEFARGLPTYGTVIGLHYRGWPVVGVLEHTGLEQRCYAAFGLGAFRDGVRVRLEDLEDLDGSERVHLPSRASFLKHGDEAAVFDRVARAYPGFRVFHTCYGHFCAVTGGVDAAIEWKVRVWDLAATRILAEEAGGVYRSLGERELPGRGTVCSAIFGRPRLVADLLRIVGSA